MALGSNQPHLVEDWQEDGGHVHEGHAASVEVGGVEHGVEEAADGSKQGERGAVGATAQLLPKPQPPRRRGRV